VTDHGFTFAATAVLLVHLAVVIFNVAALVVIPLGARLGWRLVRFYWLRLVHLVLMALVMVQAALGRACFLTLWQAALDDRAGAPEPMIAQWVNALLYWPLPLWVFAVIYAFAFAYCVALWWWVPPERRTS
jgi:hypothetical protein